MIPINEVEEILIRWAKDIKSVASCTVVGEEPLNRKAPYRTPCDCSVLNWLFLVEGTELFNFGVNAVDEKGVDPIADLFAARLSLPENWEESFDPDTLEPVMDERWICWTIPLTDRKALENELSILRWNLELGEPDESLDPRPFFVSRGDAEILQLLTRLTGRLVEHFTVDSKERNSLDRVLAFLNSAPSTNCEPNYICKIDDKEEEFWFWDPPTRIDGVISEEDLGFTFELKPQGLLLDCCDKDRASWSLSRGETGSANSWVSLSSIAEHIESIKEAIGDNCSFYIEIENAQ